TTEIYTLSLHDALPICQRCSAATVDHNTLEDLDALFVAFLDERVHPDAVARTEIRDVVPEERVFNVSDQGMGAHGSALPQGAYLLRGRRHLVNTHRRRTVQKWDGSSGAEPKARPQVG